MDTRKNIAVDRIVAEVDCLLVDQKPEAAHALLRVGLDMHDHARLWRLLRRVLLMLGDEVAAADVAARFIDHVHKPTPAELVMAGSPRSVFTPLPDHKLLYLHVSKCGSTTVKDILHHIMTGDRAAGHAHRQLSGMAASQSIDRSTLGTTHADWFKFLVVRDPVERLRSYHRFNILHAGDLVKSFAGAVDAGRTRYMGLELRPDYGTFLAKLTRYRQVFPTLRAHTNAISDIAGTDPGIYDWVGPVTQMDDLRHELEVRSGVSIPAIHNFQTSDKATLATDHDQQLEDKVRDFYALDYEVYGHYF